MRLTHFLQFGFLVIVERFFFHLPQMGLCLYSYASDPSVGRVRLRSSSLTRALLTFYQPSSNVSKSEMLCDTVHIARHPSALAGSLRTSEPVSILLWLSRRTGYLSFRFWAHSLKEWNVDRLKSGVDNSRRYPEQPGALWRLNSTAKRPIVNLGLISMIGFSLIWPLGSE